MLTRTKALDPLAVTAGPMRRQVEQPGPDVFPTRLRGSLMTHQPHVRRLALVLALACAPLSAWAAISGTVFRDYNSNGARGTFEPGIGGMTITAFGLGGTNCGSAVVAANGTYSIAIAGIANCTAAPVASSFRLELDPATIPATVAQSFQGAGNRSTLRFAADGATGVDFAVNNPAQYFPDYGGESGNALSSTESGRVANLMFSTTRFVGPEGVASTTVDGTVGAVVSTIYRAGTSSDTSNTNINLPAARIHATELQVGAVRGLAYLRGGNRILAGAYSKRHTLWGDSDTATVGKQFDDTVPDRIYMIDRAAAGTTGVSVFTTIEAGDENHSTSNLQGDSAWWDLVGRRAFGDIDVSEAEDFLYVANMRDKLIYRTAITTSFSAGTTTSFSVESVAQQACGLTITGTGPGSISAGLTATSDDNDWVPGGIKFHEGQLYVTVTCTAQTLGEHYSTVAGAARCEGALAQGSGALTNFATTRNPLNYPTGFVPLRGVVIRANPDGTGQTIVSNFPLNVDRGELSPGAPAEWLPWRPSEPVQSTGNPRPENGCTRTYGNPFGQAYYPQPWLTDIEFDENNNLLVGIADRAGDQFGSAPDGVGTFEGVSGGDIVRVRSEGDDWADGSLAVVGVVTSISPTGASDLANSEFHVGERYHIGGGVPHEEIASGQLGLALGYNEVMTNAFDPPPAGGSVNRPPPNQASTTTGVRSGGVLWLNSTIDATPTDAESRNQSYLLFTVGENGTFGKASGMGDIELIADLAPLQFGNRVWFDRNGNGIQDPDAASTAFVDEPGVSGVRVFLVNAAGDKLGEATTDAEGNYLFNLTRGSSDGNVNDAAVSIVNPYGQNLRVVLFDPVLLSLQDVGEVGSTGTTAAGLRDSDAASAAVAGAAFGGATRAVIAVTTDTAGRSNHSLDFGLGAMDYGDLPDASNGSSPGNYQTRLGDNGARHQIVAGNFIGVMAPDADSDGQQSLGATGDDLGLTDDEDVTISTLAAGSTSYLLSGIPATASVATTLCGYFDANRDGDFDDAGEAASTPVAAGSSTVNLSFTGFSAVTAGSYLRLRLIAAAESCAVIGANGFSASGEVEDHIVVISSDFGDLPNPTAGVGAGDYADAVLNAGNGSSPALLIGGVVDAEGGPAPNAAANGDDSATTDDEDATSSGSYALSASALTHNFRVPVLNATGEDATFCGFLDANGNGSFADTGEIFSTVVPNGTVEVFPVFAFAAPLTAPNYLRWRLSPGSFGCTATSAEGAAVSGEIEDYVVMLVALDFGDLPDIGSGTAAGNYQTQLGDNGPSHVINAALRIDASEDAEADGQQTPSANGDDLAGGTPDDETAGPYLVVAGATTHLLSVPVFNNTGSGTVLCGFLDLDGNGSFDSTGERTSVNVPTSVSLQSQVLSFGGASMGVASSFVRLRLIAPGESCASSGPSAGLSIGPDGPSSGGEVEDHPVTRVAADFGDLPDTGLGAGAGNYRTTSADGGAFNLIAPTSLRLGTNNTDSEADGVPTTGATGDVAGTNDENGISFPSLRQGVAPTVAVSVLNNTGATRNLCGYLDFNDNGVFDAPGEVVETTIPSSASAQSVNLVFTGSISAGQTFTNNNLYGRFRVQENACDPNGFGGAGEVEDYAFPVSEVGVAVSAIPNFCPGQSVVFTITVSNAASRATATAWPVTVDLVGADEANLAGSPSFADANWATTVSGGATVATSTGNGVDINTTVTIPAGGSVVFTVQATVANGVSLARTVAASVRPVAGSVDALASNDDGSGSSALGTCGGPPSGGGALCPVTTGLTSLTVSAPDTVVNGYWAGAAGVTPGDTVGRCVRVGSVSPLAGAADAIATGDVLLLVQMQGATINTTDTSSYGDGVANSPGGATAASAGTHEFVIAQGPVQATGGPGPCAGQTNVIEISGAGAAGGVINSYAHDPSPVTGVRSTFQVVRVPRHTGVSFSGASDSLAATPWNGSVGGVLALDVTGNVNLGGTAGTTRLTASNAGFRGAACSQQSGTNGSAAFANNDATSSALKGEGYAGNGASPNLRGLGAPGSGGGGGQRCAAGEVTGGGGGANGAAGGIGGTDTCTNVGHGGGTLPAAVNDVSRLTLGGGGGIGASDNEVCTDVAGAGGGLIIVRANAITGQGTVQARGQAAPTASTATNAGDGGGAGGTVLLLTNLAGGTTYANTTVNVSGGAGSGAAVASGGGGGGSGGRIFLARTAAALSGTRTLTGGGGGTASGAGAGAAGATNTAVSALDPVNVSPGVKPGFVCDGSSTVPVTIAQVESRNLGSELEVRFVTASEAGTLGYHVYADGDAGRTRLSRELVLATSDRGLEKQEYVVRGPQLGATSVTIEEVDVTGKSTFYGPYPLNRSVGERDFTQATDWGAIQSELAAWQSARVSALRGQGAAVAELGVSADGWYRVTGAELLAAGVDLTGVPVAELGLFVGSSPVPMQVEGGSTVGASTALSFHGRAVLENLYTTQQVYRLVRQAGPRLTEPAVASGTGSVTRYVHVERQAPQRLYSFSSPLADPWYASRIVRQGTTSPTTSFAVPVSAVESGEAEVGVTLYGGTDLPETDDHHAVLKVNGQVVASAVFDGFTAQTLRAKVDAALLTSSTTVEVGFGETPYSVDVLHIESVELRYPRRLELLEGELRMAAVANVGEQLLKSGFETADVGCGAACSATQYEVTGVNPSQPVHVLRVDASGVVSKVGYTRDGSNIRFAAAGGEGVELLVTQPWNCW